MGQGPRTCEHFGLEDTIPQLRYCVSSRQCPDGVRNLGTSQRLTQPALVQGCRLYVDPLMPLEIRAPPSPGTETGFCAASWAHSELQTRMKKPILREVQPQERHTLGCLVRYKI